MIGKDNVIDEIIEYTGQDRETLQAFKMTDLLWKRDLLRGGHTA